MKLNNEVVEKKILYQGLDWCVFEDGIFHNPKDIPYRDCLYELALAYRDKSERLIMLSNSITQVERYRQRELDYIREELGRIYASRSSCCERRLQRLILAITKWQDGEASDV